MRNYLLAFAAVCAVGAIVLTALHPAGGAGVADQGDYYVCGRGGERLFPAGAAFGSALHRTAYKR